MNQMLIWWNALKGRKRLAILFAAVTLAGCGTTGASSPGAAKGIQNQGSGWQVWKEGIAAFQEKNYNQASALFESLSQYGEDEAARRNALYALACTRLTMAEDSKDADSAMTLWRQWAGMNHKPMQYEDPRLLTPLLMRVTQPGMCDWNRANNKAAPIDRAQIYEKLLQTKDKELQQVRARMEVREREIVLLKNQIFNLKHQIESLEMIHREIQEKKKEVSSP